VITPAAVATISTIFAAVMLHERPGFVRLAGSALLIAGITLIGWDGLRGVSGPKVWLGDLLFLAAAVAWALFSVLVRRVLASPQYPSVCTIKFASAAFDRERSGRLSIRPAADDPSPELVATTHRDIS